MASTIELAGARIRRHPEKTSFLESLLEAGLCGAIEELAPGCRAEQTGHTRAAIPAWDRKLGNFDLQIRLVGERRPSVLVEAKVDDVEDTLWDLFKLTSVPLISGAVAGYLIAAASRARWEQGGDCFDLYSPGPNVRTWDVPKLFVRWGKAWRNLTGPRGGPARPLQVPRAVETAFIAASAVDAFPAYEIRGIRVIPGVGHPLPFVDGVPPGLSAALNRETASQERRA